jgi:hypothetical protein
MSILVIKLKNSKKKGGGGKGKKMRNTDLQKINAYLQITEHKRKIPYLFLHLFGLVRYSAFGTIFLTFCQLL